MMVGELTYDETFSANNNLHQVIFIGFVFTLTILLNNLLIGLTTSNVQDMMKESQRENTEVRNIWFLSPLVLSN